MDPLSTSAEGADRAARSAAAKLLARRPRAKKRRRPIESLTVAVPLDRRTKAGQIAGDLRDALLRALGYEPTIVERAIVTQLTQLKLRLLAFDDLFVKSGGDISVHDARTYAGFSTAYMRGLASLGIKANLRASSVTLAAALPRARTVLVPFWCP